MSSQRRSSVAVIGAGIMGSAIATRLIETGHEVHIFDLDHAKVAALAERGALPAATAAEAVAASRFCILSLNHANIVRAAVFGGSVEAGPIPSGGWRVRAVLPTEGAVADG